MHYNTLFVQFLTFYIEDSRKWS